MLEGFQFITIFIEGIISFFSPCIIPLIPLYMSYLAGSARTVLEDGTVVYKRKTTLFHTLFFVLGISMSFFLLGLSFSAVGLFFQDVRHILLIVCGVLIILMGLFQIGLIWIPFLQKERKLSARINLKKMNPGVAFVLGFLFSFAWTPCVGPALSSVLMMASSGSSAMIGNLYVLFYALGFVVPFLVLGLFTTEALNLLKKYQKALMNLVKVGGVLLVGIGAFLLYDGIDSIPRKTLNSCSMDDRGLSSCGSSSSTSELTTPPDLQLSDYQGNTYRLSDYSSQTVVLNFWSLSCSICKEELNSIQRLQEELGDEVTILTIVDAGMSHASNEEIHSYIQDHGYTFPVLFDQDAKTFDSYRVTSYPNTFIIRNGEIQVKVPGALEYDSLKNLIEEHM